MDQNLKLLFVVEQLKTIFESNINIPVFGICYGHQTSWIGIRNSIKMKYGNRQT